ncbi:MAG: trypsin-like serine protease [Dermatophilaceae bacterium]
MKKFVVAAVSAVAAMALAAAPALGITKGGVPDGDAHPYVGLMVANGEDGSPMWRCTGTLISPTVFLTAGHCTSGATSVSIWFDSNVDENPGYPVDDFDATGTPYTYPDYVDEAFFVYDLGVVVLDEPLEMDTYGELPAVGAVDELGKGRTKAAVTTVGYGVQFVGRGALPQIADRVRYVANSFVVSTKGAQGAGTAHGMNSMVLSGSAKGGGTCFGDSGGPTFVAGTRTVVAVTSFGINPMCAGTGGVYRIDHPAALSWISGFLA